MRSFPRWTFSLIIALGQGACATDTLGPIPVAEEEFPTPNETPSVRPAEDPSPCVPGTVKPCYGARAATLDVGECRGGLRRCDASGRWGACEGAVLPAPEVCDGLDNDCDGSVDEMLGEWTCGEDECATSIPRCLNGVLQPPQACDPTNQEVEICGDGLDNNCDGDAPPCRESYTTGTTIIERPVDVVWAIDTSSSMKEEVRTIENNVNDFADTLAAGASSSALHLIADRGLEDLELCVQPPLGGPACGDNPPGFYQYDTNGEDVRNKMVHSSNALGRIMQQSYAWIPRLQSGSHVAFVVTTDDDGDDVAWVLPNDPSEADDCVASDPITDDTGRNVCRWIDPSDGATYTSLAQDFFSLLGFETFMAKKFPNAVPGQDWTFYPIIGGTGTEFSGEPFRCGNAVEDGTEYVKLAELTGTTDAIIPICAPNWDLVGLASAIVRGVPQTTFVLQEGRDCDTINPVTINVHVEGRQLALEDWSFDAGTCEVHIMNNAPDIGDEVRVEYEYYH